MNDTPNVQTPIDINTQLNGIGFITLVWAIGGGVLWLLGFLNISLFWIIGPFAYLFHMSTNQKIIAKTVKQELIAAFGEAPQFEYGIEGEEPAAYEVADAKNYQGPLN